MNKTRKNSPVSAKKPRKAKVAGKPVPVAPEATQPVQEPITAPTPPQEPTKTDTGGPSGPAEKVTPEVVGADEAREQERTRIGKQMFLEALSATMGSIKQACERVGIHRSTFYDWRHDDPDFRKALDMVDAQNIEDAEGILGTLVRAGDGPSVRFFLQSRSEKYKPKSRLEVMGSRDERSFEDVVDELAVRLLEQRTGHANGRDNAGDTTGAPAEPAKDQGQAQGNSAVQAEPGTAPILGPSEAPQHNP